MFKFNNKPENQKKCTLLPEDKGHKVIKVDLVPDKTQGETARAILYVAPNGSVIEHSHEKTKNKDSEVYIDLLDIARNGVDKMHSSVDVAGSNSPSGMLTHRIEDRLQPQVYLAIKKGQDKNAWQSLDKDVKGYLHGLHFGCGLYGNTINLVSNSLGKNKEFVAIDFETNKVSYIGSSQEKGQESYQEFTTLDELLYPQKDFGMER